MSPAASATSPARWNDRWAAACPVGRCTRPNTSRASHRTSRPPVASAPSIASPRQHAGPRHVAELERDLGRRDVDLRHQRRGGVALGHAAGLGRVPGRGGEIAAGHGGAGQRDEQVGSPGVRQGGEGGAGGEPVPEGEGVERLARGGEHVDEHLVGRQGRDLVVAGQLAGPAGRGLGGGQGAVLDRPARALQQERSRGRRCTGGVGEVGGELARESGEARVGQLDGRPRPAGELAALGRQEARHDGLTAQGVAEVEAVVIGIDQLGIDRGPQRLDGRPTVDLGDPGEQLPREGSPQQRRRTDHPTMLGVEVGEPAGDRLPQVRRDVDRQDPDDLPVAVHPVQHAGGDQPGEQLLDEERVAVGVPLQEPHQRRRGVLRLQAGGNHRRHAGGWERIDPKDGGRSAPLEPSNHRRHLLGRSGRDDAPAARVGEGIAEVLDDGERLDVGPVQVLEHEDRGSLGVEQGEQARHRLAEQERRVVGRRRRAPGRHEPSELTLEPGEARVVGDGTVAEGSEERLGQRPERHGAADGHGPARERIDAGGVGRGLHQPRLADPGVAHEHDHAAAPLGPARDPIEQAGELVGPSDERGAQHAAQPSGHRVLDPGRTGGIVRTARGTWYHGLSRPWVLSSRRRVSLTRGRGRTGVAARRSSSGRRPARRTSPSARTRRRVRPG